VSDSCAHVFDYTGDDPEHRCLKCRTPEGLVKPDCPCCGYPHCGHNHEAALSPLGEGQKEMTLQEAMAKVSAPDQIITIDENGKVGIEKAAQPPADAKEG